LAFSLGDIGAGSTQAVIAFAVFERRVALRAFLGGVLGWMIELTADSPRAAAKQAQAIQRDTNSIATVFDVRCLEEHTTVRIDLADPSHAVLRLLTAHAGRVGSRERLTAVSLLDVVAVHYWSPSHLVSLVRVQAAGTGGGV